MDIITLAILFMFAVTIQAAIVIFLVWLLRKRQVWGLIRAAIAGHGTLLCKSHLDRSVSFKYTDKPISYVEWKIRDKVTGKIKTSKTFISKIYHTLRGTGINVHFAPITYPTNIDITTKEKSQLNVEGINALLAQEYLQGALDASNFNKLGGLNIETVQLLLMMATILMLVVNFYFTYQIAAIVGSG